MIRKVYTSKDEFLDQCQGLNVDLPYSDSCDILASDVKIGDKTAHNRIACQAMEGCDGNSDGTPAELTIRRYERISKGGAGVIWFEATACLEEGRANPRQLWINQSNLDSFKRIVEKIKEDGLKANGYAPLVFMQNTHSGRYSKPHGVPAPLIAYNNPVFEGNNPIDKDRIVSDSHIDRIKEALVGASVLAQKAGFDGVDVKCCHRYLNSELLSAYNREGRYGGSFENRTRLLRESIEGSIKLTSKDFIVSSRLNAYDGFEYPYGFGVRPDGGLDFAPDEPIMLLKELSKLGVGLLNITMGNPYFNPHVNRPFAQGAYDPPEHPLLGVARMLNGTSILKKAVPEIKIIASGFSYLGTVAPNVAAAYVENGGFDLCGFGRTIFAYPDFAKDIINDGALKKQNICICCSKCTEIMRGGSTPGCVVRDDVYREIYKNFKK